MINYKLIGQRIKEIRVKENITQEQLAEMIDVSTPYISYIESATRRPSLDILVQISNALGITVDDLLVGNLNHNPKEYQSDFNDLLSECSSHEKHLVYELDRSLIRLFKDNN